MSGSFSVLEPQPIGLLEQGLEDRCRNLIELCAIFRIACSPTTTGSAFDAISDGLRSNRSLTAGTSRDDWERAEAELHVPCGGRMYEALLNRKHEAAASCTPCRRSATSSFPRGNSPSMPMSRRRRSCAWYFRVPFDQQGERCVHACVIWSSRTLSCRSVPIPVRIVGISNG